VEIGWRLREDAWGKGYAKEAAIASLDLAFSRFGAPHVVAITALGNEPSQGLMKRLGMVRRKELDFTDQRFPPDSEVNPQIVYRIDAADWPAAKAAALA
jgi:RimJ/RimL family protein N-acetyltransferase